MWYKKSIEDTVKTLNTSADDGIQNKNLEVIREKYGYNTLPEAQQESLVKIFFKNFIEPLVLVLFGAAIISLASGDSKEAIVILIIVIINACIATYQEGKARRSLDALKKLTVAKSNVIRDGLVIDIDSSELVPGDVVLLDAGNFIPADLRIIESASLQIDESALTGESVPVNKFIEALHKDKIPLADQVNMAFSSTFITNGRAKGIVVETGANTEIGKIASLLNAAKVEKTPLQRQLESLSKKISVAAFVIGITAFLLLLFSKNELSESLLTGVTLAVAVIPESLPVIVSIVLALSINKMAKQSAIVKNLPSVETLGSVSIICTDKTGTLTKNQMTVVKLYTGLSEVPLTNVTNSELLNAMALCNDSNYSENNEPIGDPTELALTDFINKQSEKTNALREKYKRISELPFDSSRKLMSTINYVNGESIVYTKGAADNLVKLCSTILINDEVVPFTEEMKEQLQGDIIENSNDALRILGFARKISQDNEEIEANLTYLGMVGMIDPERDEVKSAIATAKEAGVETVMITGDHKITAYAIAKNLGMVSSIKEVKSGEEIDEFTDEELAKNILQYRVFARVSPEHKVKIVKAFQSHNLVVSMTGDGVNDAPSLKTADVGVAMGITGTDVSKEAANMILADDNFTTIISAIYEGRNIYDKIKRAILFILATNLAEVLLMLGVILVFRVSPLAAIHVLWINLIVESLLAIPMGGGKNDDSVMTVDPRPKHEEITKGIFQNVLIVATITFTTVFLTFYSFYTTTNDIHLSQTMSFFVMSTAPIFYALSINSPRELVIKEITGLKNVGLYIAVLIGLFLNLVILLTPIGQIFELTSVTPQNVLTGILISLIPFVILELKKLFTK